MDMARKEQSSRPRTLSEAAERYMAFRRPSAFDKAGIERLRADPLGKMRLDDICRDDIATAARRLYPKAKASTRNRRVYVPVAAILHYAADNRWCTYLRVEKETEATPEPRALSPEVAQALMATAEGDLADLLVFLFKQGWRISDALRLTWKRVDLRRGLVVYHIKKTDEWATVALQKDVRAMLARRGPGVGLVFPYRYRHAFYRALEPLCAQLGVHFTPHMARHTFATMLRNLGIEIDAIAAAGLWRDPQSVLRYGRINVENVRANIDRL
jgi:integrase